jgi:hypothetical protein
MIDLKKAFPIMPNRKEANGKEAIKQSYPSFNPPESSSSTLNLLLCTKTNCLCKVAVGGTSPTEWSKIRKGFNKRAI